MADSQTYNLTIIPVRERYYNNDSDFGVYVFKTKDKITKRKSYENGYSIAVLAGKTQQLTIGIEYKLVATLEYNSKYREYNYVPKSVVLVRPETTAEQELFLKSLVTEKQAASILSVYPNVVDDVINGKQIDTKKIKGIGDITWNKIKEKIENNYIISDILSLLSPLGVTITMIKKLLSFEENPSLLKKKIIENPYILTKIKGIGFKKADEIALKLNKNIKVSQFRTTAFIVWQLNYIANNSGDTWVRKDKFDELVKNEIPECYDLYIQFIKEQEQDGKMLKLSGNKIGLKRIVDTEYGITKKLDKLNFATVSITPDTQNGIKKAEKELGFSYTKEQQEIISKCCENSVTLISGQAGTGKSTILRGIVNAYSQYNIACCALSAKAAQRIFEATGHEASTIHRLLKYSNGEFSCNERFPIDCDVLILDEASMVNAEIFIALLTSVKEGTKLIICGDDEQLPPIGCGNIFHDLLKMNKYPCVRLTKILRQAEKSGIIKDSLQIRQNCFPVASSDGHIITGELQDMEYLFMEDRDKMRDYAIKIYLESIEKNGIDSTIIITPCKKNRINSTEEINKIIQSKLISSSSPSISYGKKEFRVGSKIIQRVNDYDKTVFNGETGKIVNIKKSFDGESYALIDFGNGKRIEYTRADLASVELAYALTVHVTQGSGYDNVIILIDSTHFKLLDSCLLYTALTRAKQKCILISEQKAFSQCIRSKASDRNTWLSLIKENN